MCQKAQEGENTRKVQVFFYTFFYFIHCRCKGFFSPSFPQYVFFFQIVTTWYGFNLHCHKYMYVFDVHHIIYGTTLDQMMRTRITPVHTLAVSTGSRQTDTVRQIYWCHLCKSGKQAKLSHNT